MDNGSGIGGTGSIGKNEEQEVKKAENRTGVEGEGSGDHNKSTVVS